MTKCALIRKVRLTTRVYGKQAAPNTEVLLYSSIGECALISDKHLIIHEYGG